MNKVIWQGGMSFEAIPESGNRFVMDSSLGHGGENLGPSPLETLICAAAACSAIDVLDILQKKRQTIESYRVEVQSERGPEGVWPRPITSMVIKHIVSGPNLSPEAVQRAVDLSDEKYCSIIATLRTEVQVKGVWEIG